MRDADLRGSRRLGARAILRRALAALGASFGYFSILPVGPSAAGPAPEAATLVLLPLVGAVVGALAGGIGLGSALVVPHGVAAALAFAALLVLSGALHVDGFLDGCDAFAASVSPQRRLEILKDPRHGTYAVVGMWLVGSLGVAALATLPPQSYPALLAFGGALSRFAALVVAVVSAPVLRANATAVLARRPPRLPVLAQALVLVACGFAIAPPVALAVPIATAVGLALGRAISRRLGGGLVGDAYGFIIVVVEVGFLVVRSAAGEHFR